MHVATACIHVPYSTNYIGICKVLAKYNSTYILVNMKENLVNVLYVLVLLAVMTVYIFISGKMQGSCTHKICAIYVVFVIATYKIITI